MKKFTRNSGLMDELKLDFEGCISYVVSCMQNACFDVTMHTSIQVSTTHHMNHKDQYWNQGLSKH